MELRELEHVYFLGIGGIGMSAIARCLHSRGISVSGYDKTPTPLTAELIAEGIPVHFDERPELIPMPPGLVVYTPAIPCTNREFIFIKKQGYPLKKRAEVLAMLVKDLKTVAVGGTHGKTSITSIVSHLLNNSLIPHTAFIGGISKNLGTNFIASPHSKLAVVEADEYDRSFLALHPDIAVISAMDADHLDIYGSKEYVEQSYSAFAQNIRPGGILLLKQGLKINAGTQLKIQTYSASASADYFADNIRISNGNFVFDLHYPGGIIRDITAGVPGRHNIENAVAAAAACINCGLSDEMVRLGIQNYMGVKRRFDVRIKTPRLIYIDDYGHHPEELRTFINSVRELYPGKKITGIFQPHLFTRTRDFATEFAESLGLLDSLRLMEIYPARELPIDGVNSGMLLDMVKLKDKKLLQREAVVNEVCTMMPEIVVTMGAGDIDTLVEPLEMALNNNLR